MRLGNEVRVIVAVSLNCQRDDELGDVGEVAPMLLPGRIYADHGPVEQCEASGVVVDNLIGRKFITKGE